MKTSFRIMGVAGAVIALFLFPSCGATVKETVQPIKTDNVHFEKCSNPVNITGVRRVAILPLADYSHSQRFVHPMLCVGNLVLQEEIMDQLTTYGLTVAVQEDVYTSLVNMGVIRPLKTRTPKVGTTRYELASYDYSDTMREILVEMASNEKQLPSPIAEGMTIGLSKANIAKLRKELKVDMVIRGRILALGSMRKRTWNPLKRGILPLVLDPIKLLAYGASPDAYEEDLDTDSAYWKTYRRVLEGDLEEADYGLFGSGLGYIIGHQSNAAWMGTAIGGFAALISAAHPNGFDSSVIQVRLYAQDARTGDILWTNRVELEYTPNSPFDFEAMHPRSAFRTIARRAIKSLMDDLFKGAQS
jgi:hypothetical protein